MWSIRTVSLYTHTHICSTNLVLILSPRGRYIFIAARNQGCGCFSWWGWIPRMVDYNICEIYELWRWIPASYIELSLSSRTQLHVCICLVWELWDWIEQYSSILWGKWITVLHFRVGTIICSKGVLVLEKWPLVVMWLVYKQLVFLEHGNSGALGRPTSHESTTTLYSCTAWIYLPRKQISWTKDFDGNLRSTGKPLCLNSQ